MSETDTKEAFLEEIKKKIKNAHQNKVPFSEFLEEKMDYFDYSNTSLSKKVLHRVERKGKVQYVPVTRQTIGAWLKGCMPSSREIYISLGMAFEMSLEEINYILLENYMGYGLYCKNIDDALWIAVVHGLFPIEDYENSKKEIEDIIGEAAEEEDYRSLKTMDLWTLLANAATYEQFIEIIKDYRQDFRDGAKQFGQCMEEVIEEEYGYYEKAAWFLRDIGCLHCEAQFSKIRAGKAIVTREWLLRFCIALQPTIESIEKLLAKAQMAPLGITPIEIIIGMIAQYKADSVANSQEVWQMIEEAASELMAEGYLDMSDDLCRKYNSVYELPFVQKWWLSICIGEQMMKQEQKREYGYQKNGYRRFASVDRLLFDDVNRNRKNTEFKTAAVEGFESTIAFEELPLQEFPSLRIDKNLQIDELELEKFDDYCYMIRPNKFTKDFVMNDIYYFSALLYTIWTGKCYQKHFSKKNAAELQVEFSMQGIEADDFIDLLVMNLQEGSRYDEDASIERICQCLFNYRSVGKNE